MKPNREYELWLGLLEDFRDRHGRGWGAYLSRETGINRARISEYIRGVVPNFGNGASIESAIKDYK